MSRTKLVRHIFTFKKPLLTPIQHVFLPMDACNIFNKERRRIHHAATSALEYQSDPFSLVSDELSLLVGRMRSMLASEFPKLASGAEYFFKMGVEGKHFRPTALLLMATAFNVPSSKSPADDLSPVAVPNPLRTQLHTRLQLIAEITELIHVGGLLHGDISDGLETTRDIGPFNLLLGNKSFLALNDAIFTGEPGNNLFVILSQWLPPPRTRKPFKAPSVNIFNPYLTIFFHLVQLSVLVGDFLLSRAYVALATLENTEVLSLLGQVVEHLATGEAMQMGMTSERCLNMQYYMEKTYYKRSSLISNSCKSIALLAGQTTDVANLAYDYGKHLGLAHQLTKDVLDFTGSSTSFGKGPLSNIRNGIVTAPLLLAMEEFPQLIEVMQRGFGDPSDVDLALGYLERSRGIEKTKDLALKHANQAAQAIDLLPTNEVDSEEVRRSRHALIHLTNIVCKKK